MNNKTKKLAITSLLTAVAILGSYISFPVFGSKCAPVQHLVNILCAVLVGPSYALLAAFMASLIRNLLAIGSLMAFPGSMFGAFLSAIAYKKTEKISLAVIGELFGTAVLGGLCAYPIAIFFMGQNAGELAFYVYILPFFISTAGGSVIASLVLASMSKSGLLKKTQDRLK